MEHAFECHCVFTPLQHFFRCASRRDRMKRLHTAATATLHHRCTHHRCTTAAPPLHHRCTAAPPRECHPPESVTTPIGDAGVKALVNACASRAMANLTQLILFKNKIGDAGVLASACASGIKWDTGKSRDAEPLLQPDW